MLNILGPKPNDCGFCDGVSRRNFLKIGALGLGGLALPELLRAEAASGIRSAGNQHKAVIMIFLPGGPSHQDMFDLKLDAPAEVRGEFKPIPTNVPGIQICEHLPRLAQLMAGNESDRDLNPTHEVGVALPGAAQGVVSVGALRRTTGGFVVAGFSNTFPQISAPGVDIKSAKVGGGLVSLNGTSMACPHVAGVAALWWQAVRGMPVRPSARVVLARMLAASRANVFGGGVDIEDRGVGLVTAP